MYVKFQTPSASPIYHIKLYGSGHLIFLRLVEKILNIIILPCYRRNFKATFFL